MTFERFYTPVLPITLALCSSFYTRFLDDKRARKQYPTIIRVTGTIGYKLLLILKSWG